MKCKAPKTQSTKDFIKQNKYDLKFLPTGIISQSFPLIVFQIYDKIKITKFIFRTQYLLCIKVSSAKVLNSFTSPSLKLQLGNINNLSTTFNHHSFLRNLQNIEIKNN